jgi:hypothetical protein
MKTAIFSIVLVAVAWALLAAFVTTASAQSRSFYGRDGSFQGSAITRGNATSFYGKDGHFAGSSTQGPGNTTTFYGKDGHYQGSVTTTAPAPDRGRR